jgi:hypothetical protein
MTTCGAREHGGQLRAERWLRADCRGVLLPAGYRVARRSWVRLRRTVFDNRRGRGNRVWETDFSEFEMTWGGPGGSES